ncbi:hypothetical protein GXM_10384 [Nostoc sphaeroides CCNUC1]|uniref:Uncharacterized protein n=1 Tax=Nostoc sphaeroides CCNUC1 TaxID=2653204 RepID=A0A5P8WGP4_9NOSO|nr:hypothetical protein GXM_09358 [Nostoc sphaeroides CCNUC1]QFS52629.1 hypothetical protein GXM_10384 [Nostoc sphaeroides CCNUC1]
MHFSAAIPLSLCFYPFSQPHFHPIAPGRMLGVVFKTKE